jgi:hypothetical protein
MRVAGKKAQAPFGVERLGVHVDAAHANAALVRSQDACQHPQRRRLACTVGAEKPDHFAGVDGDADICDGLDTAKATRQAICEEYRGAHRRAPATDVVARVEICIAFLNLVARRVLIRAICISAFAASNTSFPGTNEGAKAETTGAPADVQS